MQRTGLSAFFAAAVIASSAARAAEVRLEQLDLAGMTAGWGEPHKNKSVEGRPITLHGKTFARGVGTHAGSEFEVDLKSNATQFTATVGVDDEVGAKGSVIFKVLVDGQSKYESALLKGGDPPVDVKVDLAGAKKMTLVVDEANDGDGYDHADWADAALTLADSGGAKPEAVPAPVSANPPVIASGDPPEPRIHGARVVGGTPGRPFLFKVPVTGAGEIKIAADELPDGLAMDDSGLITGALKAEGETAVHLTATGPNGTDHRTLKIIAGTHKLARTPPMGWNSWNVWGVTVTADRVKAAADAMVSSGLAAKGYTYVNIDDGWEEATRAADGRIQPNKKFGDMKALADYVHSKGLKLGIYSSPGPRTCGGYLGTYQHEDQDARTWADWGVDYIKYDWCSYGRIAHDNSLAELQKPYVTLRDSLDKTGRDITYSLCQYGMGGVWKWGADPSVAANCWRTTGDIADSWGSMTGNGFSQSDHAPFAGPGHWNDPDMLMVGLVGFGNPHPTHLSHHEQVTELTLWGMLASPLLIGCDMSRLDPFTRDLLGNAEVVDVDQDPLGKQASRLTKNGMTEVWARPLFDGTVAVALFNRGREDTDVAVRFADLKPLGLAEDQSPHVRDLWAQKDLAPVDAGSFHATVPVHGALLLKIGTPKND